MTGSVILIESAPLTTCMDCIKMRAEPPFSFKDTPIPERYLNPPTWQEEAIFSLRLIGLIVSIGLLLGQILALILDLYYGLI